uniref:PUB 62/63 C-terminal domain-containing protein n=1 Tax=Arundo donax TaxID=35708 RepID=A0A0A8YF89_ARUDO
MSTFPPLPPAAAARLPFARVRLDDVAPFDGATTPAYARAVDALSASLTRHSAAFLELPAADAAIIRCALESARAFFRDRAGIHVYRAGRALDDGELSPACMADAFRCLGKAARAALCAIARSLRLRSDAFSHLLDDVPLPVNEVSASELLVAFSHGHLQSGQAHIAGLRSSVAEVDRGFVTLVASDHPGIEVYNPTGHWYLADGCSSPSDLLLLTGRALSHVTAGLRPNSQYRITNNENRASLMYRLMPRANAILDCSPISAAGHCIPQIYQPISASQFMDDLCPEEHAVSNHLEAPSESQGNFVSEPSLRSVLSDPLSGAFLEDAMVLSCGHSFGGLVLKKVLEMARCSICNGEVDPASLFPNLALRAVATVVKMEDDRRLFHNAALRKRRKEVTELKGTGSSRDIGELGLDAENSTAVKGVQYPFVVGERILIMGNKRTPGKFVGKEAVITSQCLNGWYLVKTLDSGESIRLQYRSLKKVQMQAGAEMTQTFLQNK